MKLYIGKRGNIPVEVIETISKQDVTVIEVLAAVAIVAVCVAVYAVLA